MNTRVSLTDFQANSLSVYPALLLLIYLFNVKSSIDLSFIYCLLALFAWLILHVLIEKIRGNTMLNWHEGGLGSVFSPSIHRVKKKSLAVFILNGIVFLVLDKLVMTSVVYYGNFTSYLLWWAPLFLLLSPIYIYLVDGYQNNPKDEWYSMGCWLTRSQTNLSKSDINKTLFGTLVKLFFAPLMFGILLPNLVAINNFSVLSINSPFTLVSAALMFIFTLDVFIAFCGYVSASRLLGRQIISVEPTVLGWGAAIICYAPFFGLLIQLLTSYRDQHDWTYWLADAGLLAWCWAFAIISLMVVYVLASVAMGLRFSNLTYRGLVDSGPYKYMKHPAYISKNLGWWLVSMPFITMGSAWEAISQTAMLLLVNLIYHTRAKTEKRHLSKYPEYQSYLSRFSKQAVAENSKA